MHTHIQIHPQKTQPQMSPWLTSINQPKEQIFSILLKFFQNRKKGNAPYSFYENGTPLIPNLDRTV